MTSRNLRNLVYECAASAGDQECGPASDRNQQPNEEWVPSNFQNTKDKASTRSALGFVPFSGQVVGEGLCRAGPNFWVNQPQQVHNNKKISGNHQLKKLIPVTTNFMENRKPKSQQRVTRKLQTAIRRYQQETGAHAPNKRMEPTDSSDNLISEQLVTE